MIQSSPQPNVYIDEQREWDAISSPVRIEIAEFLDSCGPLSVAELAARLNRPADGLYHHIKLLLKAGILEEREIRSVGRHREAIYALAGRVRFVYEPTTRRNATQMSRFAKLLLRFLERTLCASLESGTFARRGSRAKGTQDGTIFVELAWLDDQQIAELQNHYQRIREILTTGRSLGPGENRRLYVSGIALTPHATDQATADRRSDRFARQNERTAKKEESNAI